jgi:hypothetical protein
MNAIKIDVVNQKVYQVIISDELDDIYAQISNGCTTFTCVYGLDTADVIYADDEAMLKEIQGGFMLHSMKYPIVGNALILGTNLEGESVSPEVSVEFIESNMIWLDRSTAEDWASEVLSNPIQIIELNDLRL